MVRNCTICSKALGSDDEEPDSYCFPYCSGDRLATREELTELVAALNRAGIRTRDELVGWMDDELARDRGKRVTHYKRCYAMQSLSDNGRWIARCVDFDLVAAGDSLKDAKRSLLHAVAGYTETVMDTDDVKSISPLLNRRALWGDALHWYLLRLLYPFSPEPRAWWLCNPAPEPITTFVADGGDS